MKQTSAIVVATVVALMMATDVAAQTRAADPPAVAEVTVYDAVFAAPQPAPRVLVFRTLKFPAPDVAQPSVRLEFARARSYQTATPQRSWADEHPVKFGALVGAGIGAVVGIIAFKTADCPTGRVCSTRAVALTFYPTVGSGLGALLGLVAK